MTQERRVSILFSIVRCGKFHQHLTFDAPEDLIFREVRTYHIDAQDCRIHQDDPKNVGKQDALSHSIVAVGGALPVRFAVKNLQVVLHRAGLVSHKVELNSMPDGCLNCSIGTSVFVMHMNSSFKCICGPVVERLWDEKEGRYENNTADNAENAIPPSPAQTCYKIGSRDD
jgi:hypothetical protein